MNTQDPTTWFYLGVLVVLVALTLRFYGVRRRERAIRSVPHVEPVAGAPRYVNRYEPPELVAATQEVLNYRHEHDGEWPPGVDTDTQVLIMHQLARLERNDGVDRE